MAQKEHDYYYHPNPVLYTLVPSQNNHVRDSERYICMPTGEFNVSKTDIFMKHYYNCEYCGGVNESDENNCKHCGAPRRV
jgi:hypothetical protein